MAKRKRQTNLSEPAPVKSTAPAKKVKIASPPPKAAPSKKPKTGSKPITIQIIAGSYDRVLHGMTATLPQTTESDSNSDEIQFADTFLFEPHTSAIRCLALSPPSAPVPKQHQKIVLASGSTDQQIKLYHISAHPPTKHSVPALPSLSKKAVIENPQNRQLGSLVHHLSTVTKLAFPTRGKLLSAAEDCTVAVTRTRDWAMLSTIKAPVPKAVGRPSGDTAAAGETPAGVNDFAVHPSMKLMISVGKGEKCMRLWNLVTGKKAGVLQFERDVLTAAGEGKFGSGEGRKVAWGSTEDGGEEFAVGFERGCVVFGMDSKVRCKAVPDSRTKIHQMCYVATKKGEEESVLAVSTEDGRIMFYSTSPKDLTTTTTEKAKEAKAAKDSKEASIPAAKLVAQLGGKDAGVQSRIKDFVVLEANTGGNRDLVIISAGSDGSIRLWGLSRSNLLVREEQPNKVGKLLGTYETGNRVTCLAAFVMLPLPEELEDDAEEDIDEGKEV